jgi:hypothetical protein
MPESIVSGNDWRQAGSLSSVTPLSVWRRPFPSPFLKRGLNFETLAITAHMPYPSLKYSLRL